MPMEAPHMRRRDAFTLIELLVVIAIIAILAAILFPVFAQAKMAAKKTAALSQAKQTGTAIMLYIADYDDLGPTGTVPNLTNPAVQAWRPSDAAAQSPAGWFAYPIAQDEHALVWHNTIEPYRKNYDMMDVPGSRKVDITTAPWPAGYAAPLRAPKPVNFTYNGMLQSYSFTAITEISKLPLLWQGTGDISRNGAAMANPRLNCSVTGPCVFNSGGHPQAGGTGNGYFFYILLGTAKYTTYGKVNIYVSADTSARAVNMGNGNRAPSPVSTGSINPLQFINEDGTVTQNFIRGCFLGGVLYTAAFVPTNNFSGTATGCAGG